MRTVDLELSSKIRALSSLLWPQCQLPGSTALGIPNWFLPKSLASKGFHTDGIRVIWHSWKWRLRYLENWTEIRLLHSAVMTYRPRSYLRGSAVTQHAGVLSRTSADGKGAWHGEWAVLLDHWNLTVFRKWKNPISSHVMPWQSNRVVCISGKFPLGILWLLAWTTPQTYLSPKVLQLFYLSTAPQEIHVPGCLWTERVTCHWICGSWSIEEWILLLRHEFGLGCS